MQITKFDYDLPRELVAQFPVEPRSASRLLTLEVAGGEIADRRFADLPNLLDAGDLLVFNNTRVIPARLFARKQSGGRAELLIERVLGMQRVLVQVRASKPLRTGASLTIADEVSARVVQRDGEFYLLQLDTAEPLPGLLERIGHVPLPPYITRADDPRDRERYQTIYAQVPGAVAAPTAGLHFDALMLDRLAAAGVESAFLTLHVGAGTFQPVRARDIRAHRMHAEHVQVGQRVCTQVNAARARSRRVIAVGTTVVRALETAVQGGQVAPFSGETDLYIYPGYRFRTVDAVLTNFHLPGSSLLILICAFAGREQVLRAYRHAVAQRYRFFSYGDAMLVFRK
jgi:S-adenosylmethionine:tRNA ribosyltransferase-isomerase